MSVLNRNRRKKNDAYKGDSAGMMLTSLMDIFTVLVLYLLVNQSTGVDLTPPDNVTLPDSAVDTAPRQSIVIALSSEEVMIQGEPIVPMATVVASNEAEILPIRQTIEKIKAEAQAKGDNSGLDTEVTIVADRHVPYKVLKKVMLSSSNAGYGKISFAVNQK
jgi:biopolymer transport protein ExbD